MQVSAQSGWNAVETGAIVDLSLTGLMPHGEFTQNSKKFGFGFNLGLYYPPSKRIPLYVGLSGGYTELGSDNQDIHEDIIISSGNTIIDVIPVDMEVKTKNTLAYMHLSVRYIAPIRYVKPYIEPKIGFQSLATRTEVYDRTSTGWLSDSDDDLITSSKVSGSVVFAYGCEVGVLIPINESIAIKTGCAYNFGGESQYFDKSQIKEWDVNFTGSIFDPDNIDSHDIEVSDNAEPRRSRTNNFLLHIGLSINFAK